MGKEDGCFLRSMRYFLALVNFLSTVGGGCLIGLGVYYEIQAVTYTEIFNEGIVSVPLFIIVVGCLLFLIGFIGCCSVMCELKALLRFYLTAIIFVLVIQIIMVTMLFCLKDLFTVLIAATIKVHTIEAYGKTTGREVKPAMDKIQAGLGCCGGYNYTDWDDSYWQNEANGGEESQVPGSCCPDYEPGLVACAKTEAWKVGCAEAFYQYVDEKILLVAISVGGTLMLQIILAMCGCGINSHYGNRVVPL